MKRIKRFIKSTVMKYGIRKILLVGDEWADLEIKNVQITKGSLNNCTDYDLIVVQDPINDVSILQNLETNLLVASSVSDLKNPPFILGKPIKSLNEIGLWNIDNVRQTTNNWSWVW